MRLECGHEAAQMGGLPTAVVCPCHLVITGMFITRNTMTEFVADLGRVLARRARAGHLFWTIPHALPPLPTTTLAIILNWVRRTGQILRHGDKVLQIVW